MADYSNIAWTDSTFNPVIGCTKVSPGCVNCYAEELMDKRYGKVVWGPTGERSKTSVGYWRKPITWNKENWFECICGWRGNVPAKQGAICLKCSTTEELSPTKRRVFCASLSDVFEDHPAWLPVRKQLFDLIDKTPNLIWQLLTKRADKILSLGSEAVGRDFNAWLLDHRNIWMGVSVENQKYYDERISFLLDVSASVRWLSIEPQIGSIHLSTNTIQTLKGDGLQWVVVGGESGKACRPFSNAWARSMLDECRSGGIAFFMKQLGGHPDKKDNLIDFPLDLQVREFPVTI